MTKDQQETIEALTAAFDVCFAVKDEKSEVFLKWYTKKFAIKKTKTK